jgi:hypothetical protein
LLVHSRGLYDESWSNRRRKSRAGQARSTTPDQSSRRTW